MQIVAKNVRTWKMYKNALIRRNDRAVSLFIGDDRGGVASGRSKCQPALFLRVLGVVGAVEETSLEQLDGNDGEDELEEHVDDHDVDDVLE